jgi:pimeloyl-ACP methyl ester carboxylesterase
MSAHFYVFFVNFFIVVTRLCAAQEITPYKYTDYEAKHGLPDYHIPTNVTFRIKRPEAADPEIVFYYSKPSVVKFPIAIFCTGSSSREDISSVIHVHRYFLKEFLELGVGLITLEQWGVEGHKVNKDEFIKHYTRTQRLHDHESLIEHFLKNPPANWDGTFILVGVSEGGPIVTALSAKYSKHVRAIINWSGASDLSWRDELWIFLEGRRAELLKSAPWHIKLRIHLPHWCPLAVDFPRNKREHDAIMDRTRAHPTYQREFMGMTYAYHADAEAWPKIPYDKIQAPYLVVAGAKDTIIKSCDAFVEKARTQGVNITYLRVADMDHYIRRRLDIIQRSFTWLKSILISRTENNVS